MNRVQFLFVICVFSMFHCGPERAKEVLFIGNSLTYYHDMPMMLKVMLDEKGQKFNVHQSTMPGLWLSNHATNSQTLEKINSQHWDVVVLQEAPVRILIPEVRKYDVEPAINRLDSLIKEKGGETLLYEAYPIPKYPSKYCYPSDVLVNNTQNVELCSLPFQNSSEEFNVIQDFFQEIVRTKGINYAPVGEAFEHCGQKYPEIGLFEPDKIHPSLAGSYLIACVFLKAISGEKIESVKYASTLTSDEVRKLREIANLAFEK